MQSSDPRERIQKLLVTGDNRLKQGVDAAKARESYEQALAVAREAGLEESVRPLVEIRLADLERVDEHADPGLHDLRGAADAGRDDRPRRRHRLEQGLSERLEQARLA